MNNYHTPVLLQEVIEVLNIRPGEKYIDATLGGGGHTKEILERGGIVLGIDVDEEALEHFRKILRDKDIKILGEKKDETLNITISQYPNISLVQGNFRDIDKIAHSNDFEELSGIIFDLGLSSHQLESTERGFSFSKNEPLDMRMDKRTSVKAADLINALSKNELYELFTKFGEEPRARAISNIIIESRRVKPMETTEDLLRAIAKAYRRDIKNLRPAQKADIAKRVFQALRIIVNDEFNNLKEGLDKSLGLLGDNGKLAVISFHSGEDRIVKEKFRDFENKNMGVVLTKKPVIPSDLEIRQNRRARSAKLRVFERRLS